MSRVIESPLMDIVEQLLARTGRQLDEAVQDGSLPEICHDLKIQGQKPNS